MLVLKTVIYISKLLDFQYYTSLILDVFYTPLIKLTSFLRDTNSDSIAKKHKTISVIAGSDNTMVAVMIFLISYRQQPVFTYDLEK